MTTMNISLPDSLKAYVDEQVSRRRYGSTSEYVRDLIRRDLDRSTLRGLLLDGADSDPSVEAGEELFAALRDRACTIAGG